MSSLFLNGQVLGAMATKRLHQWKKIKWPYLQMGLSVSCLYNMIEGATGQK